MRKQDLKKEILRTLIGSCLVVLGVFLYAFLIAPQAFDGSQTVYPELTPTPPTSPTVASLNIYSITGSVKKIDGNTVYLETLTVDSINKPKGQGKTETRELNIGDTTKFFQWDLVPIKKDLVISKSSTFDSYDDDDYRVEINKTEFNSLKVGDTVNVEYPLNLAEVKNFQPSIVTILPYAAY